MNKTEKVEAYGYPSLGLITRFYRNCIGDEPLIHIETLLEENGNHPYKEKETITKLGIDYVKKTMELMIITSLIRLMD